MDFSSLARAAVFDNGRGYERCSSAGALGAHARCPVAGARDGSLAPACYFGRRAAAFGGVQPFCRARENPASCAMPAPPAALRAGGRLPALLARILGGGRRPCLPAGRPCSKAKRCRCMSAYTCACLDEGVSVGFFGRWCLSDRAHDALSWQHSAPVPRAAQVDREGNWTFMGWRALGRPAAAAKCCASKKKKTKEQRAASASRTIPRAAARCRPGWPTCPSGGGRKEGRPYGSPRRRAAHISAGGLPFPMVSPSMVDGRAVARTAARIARAFQDGRPAWMPAARPGDRIPGARRHARAPFPPRRRRAAFLCCRLPARALLHRCRARRLEARTPTPGHGRCALLYLWFRFFGNQQHLGYPHHGRFYHPVQAEVDVDVDIIQDAHA